MACRIFPRKKSYGFLHSSFKIRFYAVSYPTWHVELLFSFLKITAIPSPVGYRVIGYIDSVTWDSELTRKQLTNLTS